MEPNDADYTLFTEEEENNPINSQALVKSDLNMVGVMNNMQMTYKKLSRVGGSIGIVSF